MKLYANEISSATSRVRIALALKGIEVETHRISILGADAQNRQADFLKLNPQGLVPALVTDSGVLITQSLAIIEYLDAFYPEPPLLPDDLESRALSRAVALAVASEIHAFLPPRVASYLKSAHHIDSDGVAGWNRHWIGEGMQAIESLLADRRTGAFAVGNAPSVADIFLFPQAISAERNGFDLDQWKHIAEIMANLHAIPEFENNAPAVRK
jgi:maleylpyruvate isomerase